MTIPYLRESQSRPGPCAKSATEPTASLSIGDQPIPLEADGEPERSIRLEFERLTPAARVNRREDAVLEWF
jgi:hypothetical protein